MIGRCDDGQPDDQHEPADAEALQFAARRDLERGRCRRDFTAGIGPVSSVSGVRVLCHGSAAPLADVVVERDARVPVPDAAAAIWQPSARRGVQRFVASSLQAAHTMSEMPFCSSSRNCAASRAPSRGVMRTFVRIARRAGRSVV